MQTNTLTLEELAGKVGGDAGGAGRSVGLHW